MKIVNVKKLHNNVDAMQMPQCVMTGQVVVVYKVFEVNDDTQIFFHLQPRDTIERSVVHSQNRGAAHCHKLQGKDKNVDVDKISQIIES